MKKLLFALVAIGILLVGCGSIVETASNHVSQPVLSTQGTTLTSPETVCQVQQSQLSILTQEAQQDKADLAAHGDTHAAGAIKVTLLKLHRRIEQAEKAYKSCLTTS